MKFLVAGLVLIGVMGTVWAQGAETAPRARFIVEYQEAPLSRFSGDLQLKATDPNLTGAARLDADQQHVREYLDHLHVVQSMHLKAVERLIGRMPEVRHRYRVLLNGVSLDLSDAEAMLLTQQPGVVSVTRSGFHVPHTDAGPHWVGAQAVWEGSAAGPASRGEGVVIGILDSGINESHPSFAAVDGEGYAHSNPRGQLYGLCQQAPQRCNNKLIGIYDMTDEAPQQGGDLDGHGSHVAAIAAGNMIDASIDGNTVSLSLSVAGVAPRANLISYKVCTAEPSRCPWDAIFAGLERATLDGVDIINYSIGGGPRDPWAGLRPGGGNSSGDARLMLEARRLGTLVVSSAGNSGPGAGSITAPANAPWVLAVANATHDRSFVNPVLDLSGGDSAPPGTLFGLGVSAGLESRDIVHGADFGFPLCSQGDDIDFPPSGASNPWPAGTFSGQIVVCDRGITARVSKGFNVQQAGAGGMILLNTAADGESTVSDDHFLPATHLGASDGATLMAWLSSGSGHRGRLGGLTADRDVARADVLSGSSSRGPAVPHDGFLKPELTAPGSSILAASHEGDALATLSGTSMASPHVAGAAALLLSQHPDWTPAMLESALLTTLRASSRLPDGATPADLAAQGGGVLDVATAAGAGLYFPITDMEYRLADPLAGGDPESLNRPSLYARSCFETCTFSRRVTSLLDTTALWVADTSELGAASLTVQPQSFSLAPGGSQVLSMTLDVSDASLPGSWVEGRVLLRSQGGAAADTSIPLLAFSDPGALPERIDFAGVADQGAIDVELGAVVALPQARFMTTPLVRAHRASRVLPGDEDVFAPFDGDPGTWTRLVQIAAPGAQGGKVVLDVKAVSPAFQIDLYVGVDANGDGFASQGEILCSDLGNHSSSKECSVDIGFAAGETLKTAWILAQNVSPAGPAGDTVDIEFAAVPLVEGGSRLAVFGPGSTQQGQPPSLRLAWDEPRMQQANDVWHGYLLVGTTPDTLGQTGRVAVRMLRGSAASSAQALPPRGEMLRVGVPANGLHQGAFIDVPAGATRLVLESFGSGLVDLHALRRDLPGEGSGPQDEGAPPVSEAVASDLSFGGQVRRVEIGGAALTPGRWYATLANRGASFVEADLRATIDFAGTPPSTPDGAWSNPARDGHGFFLSRGAGEWVLVWYSYDHLNLPQWFIAQAPAPVGAELNWRAALLRFASDGIAAHGAAVGHVTLTRVADSRLQFTWQVDGFTGSEMVRHIDPGPCAVRNGQSFDPSGLWYPPAAPGSGFNLVASQLVEVAVLYAYDSLGMPRWLYASAAEFDSGPLALTQYRGFCRNCPVQTLQPAEAGEIAIDYVSAASAELAVDGLFAAPLSGTWSVLQPVATLSDPLPCP